MVNDDKASNVVISICLQIECPNLGDGDAWPVHLPWGLPIQRRDIVCYRHSVLGTLKLVSNVFPVNLSRDLNTSCFALESHQPEGKATFSVTAFSPATCYHPKVA